MGQIIVRSRYLATGYWRRSELTEAKFRPDSVDAEHMDAEALEHLLGEC